MAELRVLVVDDEPGMRHSIKRALSNHTVRLPEIECEVGIQLQEADSGERALEILEEQSFDLILLDHKLGGLTGVDVLDQLRRRELDVMVIMITAFATIETAVRATKSGAFDFISKPFTPDELKETVRKAASHLLMQRRARELTEEKRRVRFDFIRVLGHELKSPLGAIENYLNLMKDRISGNELDAYEQMITRSLARAGGMRKLIADLLDMTRIEAGEKKREFTTVDVKEAAERAVEGVKRPAEERGIAISLEHTGPTTLVSDRGEIDIVLNNLLSNAVKYNRDEGAVTIALRGDDESITITVRDTGIGLTEEEAAKLFQDFSRIKNAKTRDIPGSGLGLSIVKKIAELYQGGVSVESRPDVGSTFTIVLNRHASSAESQP
ncbi:MAG TPA: hypothetical protein DD670_04055 [Planctomycetaceae bacterium]|nr:hypothetical protein [Planctomycetaceae bacterium]